MSFLETNLGNLELQEATQILIDPNIVEQFEPYFQGGANPLGPVFRQPPDPPTFWQAMTSLWKNNAGCAGNAMAIANMLKYCEDYPKGLKNHPLIPSPFNQTCDGIGLWLTFKIYMCMWTRYKVWLPIGGLPLLHPTRPDISALLACKFQIMRSLGIKEAVPTMSDFGVNPWHVPDLGPPRMARELQDCCERHGECIVTLYLGPDRVRVGGTHAVTGIIKNCEFPLTIEIYEHPLQGGATIELEVSEDGSLSVERITLPSGITFPPIPPGGFTPEQEMAIAVIRNYYEHGIGDTNHLRFALCWCD